jgi:hypothetical protein
MPRKSTSGSSTSASVVVCGPNPVASASRASAMVEADSTLRKTVARLCASFQISDREASRLQCSVARIAAPSGPNGWSPAGEGAGVATSPSGAVARSGAVAFPVSPVPSIVDLQEPVAILTVGQGNEEH